MPLHPDYPEAVKNVLASDTYWQYGETLEEVEVGMGDPGELLSHLVSSFKKVRDREMASEIGSVCMSLEAGTEIEPLAWGEDLPVPHSRQVLRVIEDSRGLRGRFAPDYLAFRATAALLKASYRHQMRKHIDPDFNLSAFDEVLENIHTSRLYFGGEAQAYVGRGLTRVADIARNVFYLRYSEKHGTYAGLSSSLARHPNLWDKAPLEYIPSTKVGTVYPQELHQNGQARIIEADLITITGVMWNQPDIPGAKKKEKEDKPAVWGANPKGLHSISS